MESSARKWSSNPYLVGAGVVAVLAVLALGVVGLSGLGGDGRTVSLPRAVEFESADQLAGAVFADPGVVRRVRVDSPAEGEAVSITPSTGSGGGVVLLSTGELSLGDEDQAPESFGGTADVYDVTTLAVDLDVPVGVTCMSVSGIVYGTDEPGSVPDGFIIEVGDSARNLDAPVEQSNGIRLDTTRGLLDKEATFGELAVARSTPELEAKIEIEPGETTVFFSIYDADNTLGASVVSLGTIEFGEPATCGDRVRLSERSTMVALGDSFASGFGLPPFEPGTDEVDGNNCQRSTLSYPELLAERGDYQLESRACQGARTRDLYNGFAERGQEPQLDALQADTAVVVATIGGNDTDWIDVLGSCVLESFLGPACNANETANAQFGEALGRLAGETDEPVNVHPYEDILAEISERSPFADIVLVSYPPLFAEGGVGSSDVDRCAGILKPDQQWINQQLNEATELIAEAAATVEAQVVDLSEEFAGHGLCETDPWFMDLSGEGPLHPNADGHAAIADVVHQKLDGSES